MYNFLCDLEAETLKMLKMLSKEEKETEPVSFAIKMRNALV